MFVDECGDRAKLAVVQPEILRQFHGRLKPELRFPVGARDMDMRPILHARKEEEPATAGPKYRRAHAGRT